MELYIILYAIQNGGNIHGSMLVKDCPSQLMYVVLKPNHVCCFASQIFTKYHRGRVFIFTAKQKREITPFSYNSEISYSLQTGNKFNKCGTIWLEAAVTEKRNIDFWSLIFSFFILLVIVIRLYMLTCIELIINATIYTDQNKKKTKKRNNLNVLETTLSPSF